jgi:hypothetical protein
VRRAAPRLHLEILPTPLAVCRLPATAAIPAWAGRGPLASVTRTAEETSIVCAAARIPARVRAERGWRALRVRGPLSFDLTGVLASVLAPLAVAQVPVFALSTYDTDHVLVRASDLGRAVEALVAAGHDVAVGASAQAIRRHERRRRAGASQGRR